MDEIKIDGNSIALSGRVTMRWASKIFQKSPKFTAPSYQIDLSKVEKIDSAGLAILVHWWNQASNSSSQLTFIHLPKNLLEIAKLGGIDAIFESNTDVP